MPDYKLNFTELNASSEALREWQKQYQSFINQISAELAKRAEQRAKESAQ